MDKFERYWKLSEMEERFNSSSGGIRGLTSAWLLASLGAIGWLFSSFNHETWLLPLGFLIVVVTTLGCIGLITLWVMDQLVFHRLLSSVFLVGLKIEKDDPEIPPIRSMMMKTQEGFGTHRWERVFYLTPIFVLTIISVVVLVGGSTDLFLADKEYFSLNTYYISIFLVIAQVAAIIWVLTKLPSMSLETRPSYFEDREFTDLFASRGFEMIISRFRSQANVEKKNEG